MNALTGERTVQMAGQPYVLRFDWSALAAIVEQFGEEPNLFDIDIVAGVAALGFQKRHPELTADRLKELAPPLVPFVQAVSEALQWAYFGPEEPPQSDGKKKSRTPTGSLTPTSSASGKDSTRSNSGG